MNLNAYDFVEPKFTDKTWVDPKYKRLYSREIEYHPNFVLLKKFNPNNKSTDYYLALSDNIIDNTECKSVTLTKDKLVKIDLSKIWNQSSLCKLTQKTLISIELREKHDDGVIYYLDI